MRAFDPNGTLGARPTPQHKPQKQVTGLGQGHQTGDDHLWGVDDFAIMQMENAFGVNPSESRLRRHKDGWISDKKNSIKRAAEKYGLPPEMLAGITWSEVGGEPDSADKFKHLVLQLPGFKPSNQLSAGDVSIQLRHVAKMEGLDPDNLTFTQERQLINRLQNEDYNLEMVARHLAEMRDNVFPEQREQPLTDDQIKRLGYMYNMGEHHPLLQPDKDLNEADKSGISNYGFDLMRKLERMRMLLK